MLKCYWEGSREQLDRQETNGMGFPAPLKADWCGHLEAEFPLDGLVFFINSRFKAIVSLFLPDACSCRSFFP